ncbi:T9SS type A sorting domain-containing protein [Elusimicrobiota bacterium]
MDADVSNITTSSIALDWDEISDVTYQVDMSKDKVSWVMKYIGSTTNSATITGLSYRTPYYFNIYSHSSRDILISSCTKVVRTLPLQVDVTIDPATTKKIDIIPTTGRIKVEIPAGTFSESVDMTVKIPLNVPDVTQSILKETDVAVDITISKDLELQKNITITIEYRNQDVEEMNENHLILGYYNEENRRWVVIPSTPYPDKNKVVGTTNHLTKFQILEISAYPDLSKVIVYPNPCRPGLGETVVFSGLTSQSEIRIFNIAGELVATLDEEDGDGKYTWPAKNNDGQKLASGIYLYIVIDQNDKTEKSKGKIAILR